ncbi:MAG: type II toxin-antitoxin system RelE/ParE family toxin [Planctomycetes bacterium]|jgi:plasmid stabilization system protein ParE|nr:type II toxin-antitoxin system RelE/ParE family toxin [Planctomycetota bacterium]
MTGRSILFHPEAVEEARAARLWYGERNEDAAVAFMTELDRAVGAVRAEPSAWPPCLAGTRRHVLRRFPYSLIYRKTGSTIVVVAVAHASRRPGYWRGRE